MRKFQDSPFHSLLKNRSFRLPVLCLTGILLTACVAEPLIQLELRRFPPSMGMKHSKTDDLLVAVEPFVDARLQSRFLGQSRLWTGQETLYGSAGGDLGDVIAQMLATYLLQEQGWQAWFAKARVGQPEGGPDVTLSGRIVECQLDVRDWGLVWLVSAHATLSVDINNKSTSGLHQPEQVILHGTAEDWFFRYGPSRLGGPITRALLQAFHELSEKTILIDTTIRKAQPAMH
jgi:hypothetical protein